jgi:prophage regulatory protein
MQMTASKYALLRRRQVEAESGLPRSTLYLRMTQKLWVRPVRLGPRSVGWFAHECAAINAARAAGWSDDEIKELVARLEKDRLTAIERV